MKKKEKIQELERLAKFNYHIESLLKFYKNGDKTLDEVMMEMISMMAIDTCVLRESLNSRKIES